MKRALLLALVATALFVQSAIAETILNRDSLVVSDSQLVSLSLIPVTGPTDDDTFPDEQWCTDLGAVYRYSNGRINNGCIPDGFVTKDDSPYKDDSVADMGQRKLYMDMRANTVARYPGYQDGDWYGKSWDELSAYRKMSAHMTDQTTRQLVGTLVKVVVEAEGVGNQEHFDWSASIDTDGFDDPAVMLFKDGTIEINTKYMTGHDRAGTALMSSATPPQIWAWLFVPNADADVFNKLLEDLDVWNSEPILQEVVVDGVTSYQRN